MVYIWTNTKSFKSIIHKQVWLTEIERSLHLDIEAGRYDENRIDTYKHFEMNRKITRYRQINRDRY